MAYKKVKFLIDLEAGNLKSGCHSGQVRALFWVADSSWRLGYGALLALFHKVTNLNHLLKAPLSNTITQGIKVSTSHFRTWHTVKMN